MAHYRESDASIDEIVVEAEMVHDLGLSPRLARSVSSNVQMSKCVLLVEKEGNKMNSTSNNQNANKSSRLRLLDTVLRYLFISKPNVVMNVSWMLFRDNSCDWKAVILLRRTAS